MGNMCMCNIVCCIVSVFGIIITQFSHAVLSYNCTILLTRTERYTNTHAEYSATGSSSNKTAACKSLAYIHIIIHNNHSDNDEYCNSMLHIRYCAKCIVFNVPLANHFILDNTHTQTRRCLLCCACLTSNQQTQKVRNSNDDDNNVHNRPTIRLMHTIHIGAHYIRNTHTHTHLDTHSM